MKLAQKGRFSVGILSKSIALGMRPLDLRPIEEWAEEMVKIPDASDRGPYFRRENSTMYLKPLRALEDPNFRHVSVCAPPQGGKTIFEIIAIIRSIACKPGNILVTAQTDKEAEFYNKTKLAPYLKASPATRSLMATLSRDELTKENILLPSMYIQTQGPSLGGLNSKTIRMLLNDEVWMWTRRGTMSQLLRRVDGTLDFKNVSVSQGGKQELSESNHVIWDEWGSHFFKGTCEDFHVYCPNCSHLFPAQLSNYDETPIMKWDENSATRDPHTGEWKWEPLLKTVRIECPKCEFPIPDRMRDRKNLMQSWEYIAQNPNPVPGHASFRYTKVAHWWKPWAETVQSFLMSQDMRKRGVIEDFRDWIQKDDASFWMIANAELPIVREGVGIADYEMTEYVPKQIVEVDDPIKVRPEHFDAPRWEGEEFRIMSGDADALGVKVTIRAWKAGGLNRLLYQGYVLFDEAPATNPLRRFRSLRNLQFKYQVDDSLTFLDINDNTQALCVPLLAWGWKGMRGSGQPSFVVSEGGKSFNKFYRSATEFFMYRGRRESVTSYYWSNRVAKDAMAHLYSIGATENANDVSDEYVQSLSSEVKNPVTGKWEAVKKSKNHYHDADAQGVAGALMKGIINEREMPTESAG